MKKLVECVPNFSEGRDLKKIKAIYSAAKSAPGVKVFELEYNASHNRMLFTIVGEPQEVFNSVYASIKKAVGLLNITKHHGEHPRIGVADVIPFVPVTGVTLKECVLLSNKLAGKVANELNIPVYLYEASAKRKERINLAEIRKGEYEELKNQITADPLRKPDYGPAKMHPTAGAMVIGARKYLIAYNVNLDTDRVDIAKKIATKVREKDGGLKAVKALGFLVDGKAQVSMNLCDFEITNFDSAYLAVEKWAKKYGVKIANSEIYGMIPLAAMVMAVKDRFKATGFKKDQVLESKIYE